MKSEVFSLGKVLWMVGKKFRFKIPPAGQLQISNSHTNFTSEYPGNQKAILLDAIIDSSTVSNPAERLDLDQFIERLESWLEPNIYIKNDEKLDLSNFEKKINIIEQNITSKDRQYEASFKYFEENFIEPAYSKFDSYFINKNEQNGFFIQKANNYSPLHFKLKIEPGLLPSLHKSKKKSIILYHRLVNKKRFSAGITYFLLSSKSAYVVIYIGVVAENPPENSLMLDKYEIISDIYDQSSIDKNNEMIKFVKDNISCCLDKYLESF